MALYLYESFEKNEKNRWDMGNPSIESFEFLRQLCRQGGIEEPKTRVREWLAIHNAKSSVNIFYFWIYLQQKGEIFRLPYLDMSGENLKGLELVGAKFFVDEAKFVGSKLQEAEIIALNSDRIDFSQAIADRAFFEGCEFEGVFADSSLAGATFKGCALGKSAFEGATLYGAIFAGCELQNVYMLDKTNVRFVECDTQDSTEKMEVKNLNPAVYLGHSNAVSSVYAGAAYQYEFDGDARASYKGYDTAVPSLKGGSGMLELGWQMKPGDTSPVTVDLGLTGWVGRQQGVTFQAGAQWAF